jgi:hypothetical protein
MIAGKSRLDFGCFSARWSGSLSKEEGGGLFDKLEAQSTLQKTMTYLERSIEMVYNEISSPEIDNETKAKRMYLLTQLITALIKLKQASGREAEPDERLVDMMNKVPLTVVRGVERETGLRFRARRTERRRVK